MQTKNVLLGFLWLLTILEVPIKWTKVVGGFTFAWVGYEVLLREHALGISERRAAWLDGWLRDLISIRTVGIGRREIPRRTREGRLRLRSAGLREAIPSSALHFCESLPRLRGSAPSALRYHGGQISACLPEGEEGAAMCAKDVFDTGPLADRRES